MRFLVRLISITKDDNSAQSADSGGRESPRLREHGHIIKWSPPSPLHWLLIKTQVQRSNCAQGRARDKERGRKHQLNSCNMPSLTLLATRTHSRSFVRNSEAVNLKPTKKGDPPFLVEKGFCVGERVQEKKEVICLQGTALSFLSLAKRKPRQPGTKNLFCWIMKRRRRRG